LVVAATSAPRLCQAQETSSSEASFFPLHGRHVITANVGFLSQAVAKSDVSSGTVDSEARSTGFLGSLSYAYWVSPEWSVGVSAGALSAEASSSVEPSAVTSRAASVNPLLFGGAYHPEGLAITPSVRPFGSLAVGPYLGFATNTRVGSGADSEAVSDAAIGLRGQVGVDLFFARRFRAQVLAGYDLIGDFEEQIGSDKNYSGPEFSLGFGVLLGAGR
jgi:hypothetical protein